MPTLQCVLEEGSRAPRALVVERFSWEGRLIPDVGLVMDLTLGVKDPEWLEVEDPTVFVANGRASISSTFGTLARGGLLVGSDEAPFSLEALEAEALLVDGPEDEAADPFERAFDVDTGVHGDTIGDHRVRFERSDSGLHHLEWSMTIQSEEGAEVRLTLRAEAVAFEGFSLPWHLSAEALQAALARFTLAPQVLRLGQDRRLRWTP
jgi:hypothetical protein